MSHAPLKRPASADVLLALPLASAFAFVFFLALVALPAYDLGWQLRTGELIVQQGRVPMHDVFGWPTNGERWVVHEWLANVLFYLAYTRLGPLSLVIYKGVAAMIVAGLLLARGWRRTGLFWPALGAMLLGAATLRPYTDVRPQMLTFALLAALMLALDEYRAGRLPWLPWGLPPLFLIWANLHGGVVMGLGALALWIAGEGLGVLILRQSFPGLGRLALGAAAGALAGLINPNHIWLYHYPFRVLSHPQVQDFILEWNSPNFHRDWARPLQMVIALTVVLGGLGRQRRLGDLLLAGAAIYASLGGMRHMALVAILAPPLLADGASEMLRRAAQQAHLGPTPRWAHLLAAVTVSLTLMSQAWRVYPRTGQGWHAPPVSVQGWFDHVTGQSLFPRAAASILAQDPTPGRLFNDYAWGGYLIWRLYPRWQVFIDGRAEVYYHSSYDAQEDLHYARNWRQHLDEWGIDTVLTAQDGNLGRVIRAAPGWKVTHVDDVALLARRVSRGGDLNDAPASRRSAVRRLDAHRGAPTRR
ncbi:MAG: hypothetical protein HY320_02310 [Armatimonadetes bacterium]|nr:hypothetical protein [Armatimonadota bacterium]